MNCKVTIKAGKKGSLDTWYSNTKNVGNIDGGAKAV